MLPRFAEALHEIIAVRRTDVAAFAAVRPGVPIPPKMAAIYAKAKKQINPDMVELSRPLEGTK